MGVECRILIQSENNGAFKPGQTVAGTVRYFINKPKKIRTIDITFVGNGTCHWSDGTSGCQYENEEEYIKVNRNLFKARHDQECLISGTYEYPFEFLLPDDIPSSVKFNTRCKIEYKVIVTFVKAKGLTIINEFIKEVSVFGYVRPCSPEPLIFGLAKNHFTAAFNIKVEIEAEIEKTFLIPGENIRLKLAINNDSDVPINIKAALIECLSLISDDKKTHESVRIIKQRSRSILEKSISNITCVVPTLPNLYSVQQAKILIRGYKVKLAAELPDPHANAEVEVPVVIGVRRDHLLAVDVGNEWNPSSSKTSGTDDFNLIEL